MTKQCSKNLWNEVKILWCTLCITQYLNNYNNLSLTIQNNNINTIQYPKTASCNINYIWYHRILQKINISHHLTFANNPNILDIINILNNHKCSSSELESSNNPCTSLPSSYFPVKISLAIYFQYIFLLMISQLNPCHDLPSLFITPDC